MNTFKSLSLAAAVAAALFTVAAPEARAQVSIDIGMAPLCPYGYYDYAPYDCAPSGYYGPQWFSGGGFIGAGPWFRGPEDFRGHVNNRYDVKHGFGGGLPHRGDGPDWSHHSSQMTHFSPNAMHDGRGGHFAMGNAGGGHMGGGHIGGGGGHR